MLSIKLYLQKQIVGQIGRLWLADPCPEEGRGITCGICEEGGFVEIKSGWGMILVPRGPPGGSEQLGHGGPSEEVPLGPQGILTLRVCVWGVWVAEAVGIKVSSPSLRVSHTECKL